MLFWGLVPATGKACCIQFKPCHHQSRPIILPRRKACQPYQGSLHLGNQIPGSEGSLSADCSMHAPVESAPLHMEVSPADYYCIMRPNSPGKQWGGGTALQPTFFTSAGSHVVLHCRADRGSGAAACQRCTGRDTRTLPALPPGPALSASGMDTMPAASASTTSLCLFPLSDLADTHTASVQPCLLAPALPCYAHTRAPVCRSHAGQPPRIGLLSPLAPTPVAKLALSVPVHMAEARLLRQALPPISASVTPAR